METQIKTAPSASTPILRLPAIAVNQFGYRLAITKMTTRQLLTHCVIERFDPDLPMDSPSQGYQRPADESRHRAIGKWLASERDLRGRVMIPGAIILSLRDEAAEVKPDGTIEFHTAYQVDGQNRVGGAAKAGALGGPEFLNEFEFPVVLLLGVTKVDEMYNFAVVNGEQKGVRSDLVNMLLAQIQRHEGEENLSIKDVVKVVLSETTTLLNADSASPWYGRIIMPGQATPPSPLQTVRATSFMTALRPLEELMFNKKHSALKVVEQRVEELAAASNAFWSAVKSLPTLEQCFSNPDDYVLLKTPGVFALGLIARWIADQLPLSRRSDVSAYRDFLAQSESLQKAANWYAGDKVGKKRDTNRGWFANYGSMKGFTQLANELWREISEK